MDLLHGFAAASSFVCTALPLTLVHRLRARLARESPLPAGPSPFVRVIVPVKGALPGLEQNFAAILSQDYPAYEVVAVTEDASDPASPALSQIVAGARIPARLIHAGRPTRRGGKIQNLLAGVDAPGRAPEVYVFLDADARPSPSFLAHLVRPLYYEAKGGITTGYRWFQGQSMSGLLRLVWNAIPLHFQSEPVFTQAWGGATAITRETFEAIKVRSAWDRAVSDDTALTRAARLHKRPICFIPEALSIDSREEPLAQFWNWGLRQSTILRCCARPDWLLAFCLYFGMFSLFLLGLLGLGIGAYEYSLLALAPLLVMMLQGWFFVRAGRHLSARLANPHFELRRRSMWLFPLGYLWMGLQIFAVSFRRTISWGGATYRLEGPFRAVRLDLGPLPDNHPQPHAQAGQLS